MNDIALLAQALLIGLAAWRLASLLVNERGPYNMFVGFRERLGYEHDESGKPSAWPGGWREVFSCVWCLAIWTSLLMWGLWELEELIVVVWAAAAMAIVVERWSNG
jgi:hypothetical protein